MRALSDTTTQARHLVCRAAAAALLFLPVAAAAQQRPVISGRVTSSVGVPIAGATVYIEGANVGSVTENNGAYRIVVPPELVPGTQVLLIARSIGFHSRSYPVILTISVNRDFTLESNPLHLGEVVITGSGTESFTEKLGNTINSVAGTELLRSNEQNLVNALAAKAPNVLVTSESGDPGASSSIHIRGLKTITGTGQPLFVIDGTPIDNTTVPTTADLIRNTSNSNRAADVNPDDIESVEVLKGAAAGALYGARAGQGVILITTKHGSAGSGTHYTFRSSATIDQVNHSYPLQMKYGQGTNWVSGACATANCSGVAASFGPAIADGVPLYDHTRELFQNGQQIDDNLSVSSGSDRTRFFLSGSGFGQSGIFGGPNNTYHRYSARLNATHQFTDNLSFGANVAFVDTRGGFVMRGSNLSGVMASAMRTPPDFNNVYWMDSASGTQRAYRFPHPTAASGATPRGADNPFFILNRQSNTQNTDRTFGNVHADWVPLSWLSVKETLGSDFSSESRLQALPQSSSAFPSGQVISFQFSNTQIDNNLVATAAWTANANLGGTVVIGQNLNIRRYQQDFVQGNTLLAPQPFKLSNTLQQVNVSDAGSLIHNEGYFAQGTFDLYQQLFVTLAVRNDGSSTFSDNSRRNWFPKASAAWTFTDRLARLGLSRWLSFGKLRAAYGEVGQEPAPYQLLSTLTAGGTFCDPVYGCVISSAATQGTAAGLFSSTIKGQNLIKPERTTEFETGIDLGLLGDRADLGFTYYDALSRDVIFLAPLATSTGFGSQVQNAGRIRNSGVELTLNLRPVNRANLGWDVGLQWARNDNRVQSLGGARFVTMPGGVNLAALGAALVGGRVGSVLGNDFVRCGVADVAPEAGHGLTLADVQAACAGQQRGTLVIAADGFPFSDLTTRQIGDPTPAWTAGVSTAVRFRKLRFTALLDVRHGGQVLNGSRGTLVGVGAALETQSGREGTKVFGQTWMSGQAVVGPGAGKAVYLMCPAGQSSCGTPAGNWFAGNGGGFGSVLAQFAEDAGFAKLREVAVAYALDGAIVRRALGVSSVDLKLAARNLRTWTKYTGWDPETSLTGAVTAVSGIDLQDTPQTRSFVFTVTLNW